MSDDQKETETELFNKQKVSSASREQKRPHS